MNLTRRAVLVLGGGLAASLAAPRIAAGADAVEILMGGTANGSRVWFDPIGLRVLPGTTIRWTNSDAGNAHTSTAYPRRIPDGARPWNSGFLLPGKSFEAVLDVPGVYDYYCIPHQHAGMVGRIVVAEADAQVSAEPAYSDAGLPAPARDGFPSAAAIMAAGMVRTGT